VGFLFVEPGWILLLEIRELPMLLMRDGNCRMAASVAWLVGPRSDREEAT
jgi:hypothetical protein